MITSGGRQITPPASYGKLDRQEAVRAFLSQLVNRNPPTRSVPSGIHALFTSVPAGVTPLSSPIPVGVDSLVRLLARCATGPGGNPSPLPHLLPSPPPRSHSATRWGLPSRLVRAMLIGAWWNQEVWSNGGWGSFIGVGVDMREFVGGGLDGEYITIRNNLLRDKNLALEQERTLHPAV